MKIIEITSINEKKQPIGQWLGLILLTVTPNFLIWVNMRDKLFYDKK